MSTSLTLAHEARKRTLRAATVPASSPLAMTSTSVSSSLSTFAFPFSVPWRPCWPSSSESGTTEATETGDAPGVAGSAAPAPNAVCNPSNTGLTASGGGCVGAGGCAGAERNAPALGPFCSAYVSPPVNAGDSGESMDAFRKSKDMRDGEGCGAAAEVDGIAALVDDSPARPSGLSRWEKSIARQPNALQPLDP